MKLRDKDITELFAKGDIDEIIDALVNLRAQGYKEIYWDTWNCSIDALGDRI